MSEAPKGVARSQQCLPILHFILSTGDLRRLVDRFGGPAFTYWREGKKWMK
jgi:hypothetical protein